jgi:hypothetical protein
VTERQVRDFNSTSYAANTLKYRKMTSALKIQPLKATGLWDMEVCSLVQVDDISEAHTASTITAMMMETLRSSERRSTSV